MTNTNIRINGEERDSADLTMPATGREFRDAWQFEGAAVTVNLAAAKQMAHRRVNEWRRQREEAGFDWETPTQGVKQFQSDERSAIRMISAVLRAQQQGAAFQEEWKAADNTRVPVDAAQMQSLFSAMGGRISALFDEAEAVKAQVDAAASDQELKAILDGIGA